MAEVKDGRDCPKNGEKVSTIAPEDIMIITELAEIGLTQLKAMLPDIKEVVDKGDAKLTKENYEHLRSLVVAGADTVVHFSNMCQYLNDMAKKSSK